MESNIIRVGIYKLCFSMSALAFADRELKARNLKTVLEIVNVVMPALASFQGDSDASIDLSGVDFETATVLLWALLQKHHESSYEECLDGPLSSGRPDEWLKPLFVGIMEKTLATGNEDDSDEAEAAGNATSG